MFGKYSFSAGFRQQDSQLDFESGVAKCMIKIFRGGRGGGWGGGISERMLEVGWWEVGVIKGSFQKHLKTGGG